MCDPVTLSLTATYLSAAGAVGGGVMAFMQGQANGDAYDAQARLREEKAKYDSAQAVTKFQRTQGAAIANAGTTGIDLSSFSDVLADSAMESALEVKAIQFQGSAEAANLRFQADGARFNGTAALVGSVFQAAGGVAGGMGKAMAMAPAAGGQGVAFNPWGYQVQRNFGA